MGLVGVLNFFNAILTGIITRKREMAVLQSIGMTGKQLKTMLVCEGLLYALSSVLLSLVLAVVLGPLAFSALQSMFWFFTYRFTLAPILAVAPVLCPAGRPGPPGGVPLHLQTHRGGAPAGVGQLTKPYNGTAPPPWWTEVLPLYISP